VKLIGIAALVAGLAVAGGASAATNLIVNGDFSADTATPTGFSPGTYTYVPPPPGDMSETPEGTETITTNPVLVHPSWVDLTKPGGMTQSPPLPEPTNPMLVVNGITASNAPFWQEDNITTTAGGTYDFSANVMDVCCNPSFGSNDNEPSDIIFQVSVNGGAFTNVASYTTTPGTPAQSGDSGVMQFITGSFTSTAGGHFSIQAINGDSAASGNDFAIDNIVVSAAPEPTTWGLMIIGVGMAGGALRAARKSRRLSAVRAT
jgi:hypothetical protein